MGACQTQNLNTSEKYYFNDVQDVINNDVSANIASMEQHVSLTISLKNVDTNDLYKVELIIYTDPRRNVGKSAGFTENISRAQNSNEINFENFFAIPYFFERQQLLDFRIHTGDKFGVFKASLGSIMGSRKQTLIKKLSSGVDIYIKGREIKRSNKILTFNVNLNGNFPGMGITYSIINQGTQKQPSNVKLYDSEILNATVKTKFKKCVIPVMFLNPSGNAEENIVCIEIKDIKHKTSLGNYTGPISRLLVPDAFEVNLNQNNKAKIKCNLENNISFVSYLRSGMNINLTIGIDFTSSNLAYKKPTSLHYLENGMNDYEKAIKSCGDILAYYDSDQLFPVFGFGFEALNRHELEFTNKYGKFNYPINCNVNDPNINTIDNVLKVYREFISKIHLLGPTNFAPIINDLNDETKEDLRNGKTMNYNILMILTDGKIDDMRETIDALVEASYLPISVIIVGIGNGNFGNMDILDADENPLYDRNHRKADRDLVQFVPFNDFKNDPQKLAEQVLEEIPRQVIEYYQHKGIKPVDDEEDNNNRDNNTDNGTILNSDSAPGVMADI